MIWANCLDCGARVLLEDNEYPLCYWCALGADWWPNGEAAEDGDA